MKKSLIVILILGVGSVLFIGFLTTNLLQTSPKLNRFFKIRNTIAEEEGIVDKGIRLPLDTPGGVSEFTFDLEYLESDDVAYLEALAGRVFHLEEGLRKESRRPAGTETYFPQVVFVGPDRRKIRINARAWKTRAVVHEAIAPGGSVRMQIAAALEMDPDDLAIDFEEAEPLSPRVGLGLRLPEKGERAALLEKAARATAATFDVLRGQVQYVRVVFQKEDGGISWSALSPIRKYMEERKRAGNPAGLDWNRVLQVREGQ